MARSTRPRTAQCLWATDPPMSRTGPLERPAAVVRRARVVVAPRVWPELRATVELRARAVRLGTTAAPMVIRPGSTVTSPAAAVTATSAVRARRPRASFSSPRSRSSPRGEGTGADRATGHSEPPTSLHALSRSVTLPRNCSSIFARARSASSRAPCSRTSGPTAISISMRASC